MSSGPAQNPDLKWALETIAANALRAATPRAYYEGNHRTAFATEKMREAFGRVLRSVVDNLAPVVVDTVADRLQVDGFTVMTSDDTDREAEAAEATAREIWRRNRMAKRAGEVHQDALVDGDAYVIVWPDPKKATDPILYPNRAAGCAVRYDEEQPGFVTRAAKVWLDERKRSRLTLYYADRIERYRTRAATQGGVEVSQTASYEPLAEEDGGPVTPNPYGKVPVFHFNNRAGIGEMGKSELSETIPLFDVLNKTVVDRVVAQEFYAFPQRWAVGLEDGDALKLKPGGVWWTESDQVKFGQFAAGDMAGYVTTEEATRKEIARVSRTPLHYFTLEGNFPSGEALALDTLVPTPAGLRPLGEIEKGDAVYDEQGRAQYVLEAFPVLHDRPCYRVRFDDGTEFVADANHKWLTEDFASRERRNAGRVGERVVRTTAEIAASVKNGCASQRAVGAGKRGGLRNNHSIQTAGALEAPRAALPLDPYVLGCWLGDGNKNDAALTAGAADMPEMVAQLEATGESVTAHSVVGRPDIFTVRFGGLYGTCRRGHPRELGQKCKVCENLTYRGRKDRTGVPPLTRTTGRGALAALGLLGNKHIPEVYLTASPEQRLALLQGVMDTDGHCNKLGYPEIALSHERLARDLRRLILSLGHKVKMRVRESKHYGRVVNLEYRMIWSAPEPVFRLPRKLGRQKIVTRGGSRHRFIESVEPVDSVPVRCLMVSGPSHLFLVGEECVPTHNSMKTADAPLLAKVRDRQISYGMVWADVMRFALQVAGKGDRDVETVWANTEPRSEKEELEKAALKTDQGIPRRQRLRELGYTDEQIDVMDKENAEVDVIPQVQP